MSTKHDLSTHIRRTSKTLIKEGQFNWLKDKKKLRTYKSGLESWIGHMKEYLEKRETSSKERSIAEGEILRFKGTIRNIDRVLSEKY